jgi:PAS domain S-box-containing protein
MNQREDRSTFKRMTTADLLASAVGVWIWDVAGKRLRVDSRFAELYGLDRLQAAEGLDANVFFSMIHPADQMRIRVAVAGVMFGAELFNKQFRIKSSDEEIRWVAARGAAERDSDNQVLTFSGVLTDITEQKRVEERLRIAQLAGGVGTFEYIGGFGTVDVSEQFCRLLGLTPTDSVALRAINATMPADSPPLIGGTEQWVNGELSYREFKITRADTGESRWIARRGELRADAPAGGQRFIGVIYDVTAYKTLEERLRNLTRKLGQRVAEQTRERDRVWNNSRDLIGVLDDAGIFCLASPSWTKMLGYESDELIGRSFIEFVVPEDLEATRQAMTAALAARHPDGFENRYRHKDGSYRWISWQTSLEDGMVYAYGRDVTKEKSRDEELRRTEEQLRQSQKMEAVGQLTGGLAHDFNNMLTGIMGGLDIIRRRINDGKLDELDRFMDGAMRSAQRAASLTHRLLAFSRQQSLDPRSVDVNMLIKSLEDLLVRTLGEQVRLQVTPSGEIWPALCDVNQLESALLNLAINARDAMPSGGQLTIEVENYITRYDYLISNPEVSEGHYVAISVMDTGCGMDAFTASKAFEPFFTTKPIGQGTGLGLSTIYGFLRQIGGHASLRSEIGKGTTVTMYLPRFTGPPSVVGPKPEEANEPSGQGQTVLVVEDEESVRMLIIEVLDELGYRALQAANGDGAILHLKSPTSIDLLITDVGLPGLNGRQLAEIARQERPGLPVLFLTGYAANAANRANFLDPGMEMIFKPFAMQELATKIGKILGSGRGV